MIAEPPATKPKNRPPPPPLGNQRAKGNKGGGRPTKLTPTKVRIAKAGWKDGWTDAEVAKACGVSEATAHNWRHIRPEFFEAQNWKDQADDLVERSLFQRALGYQTIEHHVSSFQGVATVTPVPKHVPGDATSAIFWLKNRKREQWGDQDQNAQKLINLNITFGPAMVSNPVSVPAIDVHSQRVIDSRPSDTPAEAHQVGAAEAATDQASAGGPASGQGQRKEIVW